MQRYFCLEIEAAQTGEDRVYYYRVILFTWSSMCVSLVGAMAVAVFACL